MIGNLYCKEQSKRIEYYFEKLERATQRLDEYRNLKNIFRDFDGYREKFNNNIFSKNVVFNLLSNEKYENPYTGENLRKSESPHDQIQTLENALEEFFGQNKNFNKVDYTDFVNKLTSWENFTSIQAYNEIKIGYELKKKLKSVDLFYKTTDGKKPDLYAKVNDSNLIIELTGLNSRQSEIKIENIVKKTAEFYLSEYSNGQFLFILFDTFDLPKDDDDHIDEARSIETIKMNLEKIQLNNLKGFNGIIDFRNKTVLSNSKNLSL
jgi:hypothetical protein